MVLPSWIPDIIVVGNADATVAVAATVVVAAAVVGIHGVDALHAPVFRHLVSML
jgi:hypothetical protein